MFNLKYIKQMRRYNHEILTQDRVDHYLSVTLSGYNQFPRKDMEEEAVIICITEEKRV